MEPIQTILKFDEFLYIYIRGLRNPFAFYFFEILSNALDLSILILTAYWLFSWFFLSKHSRGRKLTGLLMPILIATIITEVIKMFVQRGAPAPYMLPWIEIPLTFLPSKHTFPSGHAARAFAFAVGLSARYPKKKILFYSIAALIGFSRLYIGAHFPLDVFGGAVLGSFIAWLYFKMKPLDQAQESPINQIPKST